MNGSRHPRFRIRDFNFWKESFQWTLLVVLIAGGIALGFWDIVIATAFCSILIVTNVLRRVDLNGQPLVSPRFGPSVFVEGWRALVHDTLTLTVIIIAAPTGGIVFAIVVNTLLAWIGVAFSLLVAFGALIALLLELRRRERGERQKE